jgi:signal peptidase I
MKPIRVFRDVVLALTAVSLAIAAGLSIYFQLSFLTITSRSMEPTISAGDMVLTRPIPVAEIRSRDVVVLPVPDVEGLRYSHRVMSVTREFDDVVVTTKGDANPKPDAWTLQITSQEVPKVVAVIPTAPILNGPIERKWIYYGLFYGGAALGLYASWMLVRRKAHSSMLFSDTQGVFREILRKPLYPFHQSLTPNSPREPYLEI